MLSFRTIPIRRAVPAALAVVMLASVLPAATVASNPAPPNVRASEWKVLNHLNRVRERQGLAPLRMAGGVRNVARDRSRSMKNQDYFAHTSPSGVDAGNILRSRSIRHAFWGEAIGWTVFMDLDEGARHLVNQWAKSPGHRRLMLRQDFNYVGIGVSRAGKKTYWTAVFANQPDHTAPKATLDTRVSRSVATANTSMTVRWTGRDRKLSTRTAGLKAFILQHRRANGDWNVIRRTSQRSATVNLGRGDHYFRLRAVDRRGNRGSWQTPLKVSVR
jgi:uncharacterized protein YkwD